MSRRSYAENDGRTVAKLLSEGVDLVYYAQPGIAYPGESQVVDYDLSHLDRANAASRRCAELNDVSESCNGLVMNLPRFVPLAQTQLDICAASRILTPAGRLWLVMPRKSGETRVAGMLAAAFGRVVRWAGRPCVFECHSPLSRPSEPALQVFEHHDSASGKALEFTTRPGLFSPGKIDPGTRLLMETVEVGAGDNVLDVGCGYGAIGVVASARGADVEMVDCDCRAIGLADVNLRRNALTGSTRLAAALDALKDSSFDVVLSNPPTHGGSALLRSLFRDMVRVCAPPGYVALVLRQRLNYEKWLVDLGDVTPAAVKDGYKVLRVSRS